MSSNALGPKFALQVMRPGDSAMDTSTASSAVSGWLGTSSSAVDTEIR